MASLPARQTASFFAIQPIPSATPLDDEFNAMVGTAGFLKGGTTGIKLLVKSSDAADPPLDLDQVGAGPILRGKKNGASRMTFDNSGNLIIAHGDGPGIFLNNTDAAKQASLTVNDSGVLTLDAVGIANVFTVDLATRVLTFLQSPTNVTAWSVTWFYSNLPPAVETTESKGRYIVPVGTAITITSITAVWAAGSDSGASNIFTIKRRNSAGTLQSDVGTVDVNTPAQNALQSSAVSVALTAGDQIYPLFTTRNTATEQLVTISVRGTQKLT